LKAWKAVLGEAFPPEADGVAVAIEAVGDSLVGGVVVSGGGEDEAAAESEGLGSGTGAGEGFELGTGVRVEDDAGREGAWHEEPPCLGDNGANVRRVIIALSETFVQTLAANL
jgi:hypothetical protein